MCALCGVLGGSDHWTGAVDRPGVFTRNTDARSRRRERLRQVACANRILSHFGLSLSDWQGASFLLSTRTGKTEIIDNLTHLWARAEALCGRACDPLDPDFLARLGAADG